MTRGPEHDEQAAALARASLWNGKPAPVQGAVVEACDITVLLDEAHRVIETLVLAAQHTAASHQDHAHLWLAANRAARLLGMPEVSGTGRVITPKDPR